MKSLPDYLRCRAWQRTINPTRRQACPTAPAIRDVNINLLNCD